MKIGNGQNTVAELANKPINFVTWPINICVLYADSTLIDDNTSAGAVISSNNQDETHCACLQTDTPTVTATAFSDCPRPKTKSG